MAVYFLDYEGGNDANDGLSFANRWKTFGSGATAARIAPGDTIRVMGSPVPTSLGVNGTWTNLSPTVTLASALNALIDNCDTAWTASPNVTCTANTSTYRTPTGSASMAIAAGFTTGLAAYKALAGATDYSAYQGITFWIQVNATVAASTLSIRLCSDAAGAVTVDTLVIPALPIANAWVPVYIDKGSALGASIQSIALYCDADPGTVTVLLDNISTVKAAGNDNLNLTSLIGKNTAGEYWWALRSINGTTVTLDNCPLSASTATILGYVGTTETVTTHKRETIKTTMTTGSVHVVQDSGSSGNSITFSGGWNRTDMSTQDGVTYFDGQCANGTCLDLTSRSFIHLDKLYAVRYGVGINVTAPDCSLGTVGAVACGSTSVSVSTGATRAIITEASIIQGRGNGLLSQANGVVYNAVYAYGLAESASGLYLTGRGIKATTLKAKNINGSCLVFSASTSNNIELGTIELTNAGMGFSQTTAVHDLRIKTATISNITGIAFQLLGGLNVRLDELTVTNSGTALLVHSSFQNGSTIIGNLVTSGNTTVISSGAFTGDLRILKSSFAEASPLSFTGSADYYSGRIVFQNFDGTAGDHRTYYGLVTNGATVFSDSTTRHSSSGLSWKFNVGNATYITSNFPVVFPVARVAVKANENVFVAIWTRRANTTVTGTFRCRGGQVAGIANDITASSSAASNVWEQLVLTLTPTEDGVVDLDFTMYGAASTDLFIHDFSVIT